MTVVRAKSCLIAKTVSKSLEKVLSIPISLGFKNRYSMSKFNIAIHRPNLVWENSSKEECLLSLILGFQDFVQMFRSCSTKTDDRVERIKM